MSGPPKDFNLVLALSRMKNQFILMGVQFVHPRLVNPSGETGSRRPVEKGHWQRGGINLNQYEFLH